MNFVTDKIAVARYRNVLIGNEPYMVRNGITGVLNVAPSRKSPDYNEVEAQHCGLYAGPGNKVEAFRFTVDTGCRMLSSHEKIVVHCSSGRGRAPLIIAAIICKMQGYEQSMMSCYEMVGGRLEQAGRKVFWYKKGAKRHLLPLAQEWYTLKNGT